jgi:hypothetical protein
MSYHTKHGCVSILGNSQEYTLLFNTRCPSVKEIRFEQELEFREVTEGRWAACHFAEEFIEQT